MTVEREMPGFDPRPTEYPFGKYTDEHYLIVKKNDGTVFDADYPYVDRSARAESGIRLFRFLLNLIGFPVMRIRLGLKVRGRENLRKHASELACGAVSCANHVHLWDYMAVMYALRPRRTRILVWAPNVRGENGKLIRNVGGIPVPEGSPKATAACVRAVKDSLGRGEWLHVYGEGSMWEYYRPVRPFKNGVAYFACGCSVPVLPLAFSYREPGFIRKRIFHQKALFTLTVGKPIFPDPSLPRREAEKYLTVRAHEAVCRLAGIAPEENLYPPVFDRTERVDYY